MKYGLVFDENDQNNEENHSQKTPNNEDVFDRSIESEEEILPTLQLYDPNISPEYSK